MGRPQVKPTTECLRGVVTYLQGDMKQGSYGMTLTDLMNTHYTNAVREAMESLPLGRAATEVAVGDLVEVLLSISCACKDAMLEWCWLGVDLEKWPPQRLDWEMFWLEHVSYVSNMEASLSEWLHYPWHIAYSALRCMACRNWQTKHACPVCSKPERNNGGKNSWSYMSGYLPHLHTGTGCMGSLFNVDSPETTGAAMIPTIADLLRKLCPDSASDDDQRLLASHNHSVNGTSLQNMLNGLDRGSTKSGNSPLVGNLTLQSEKLVHLSSRVLSFSSMTSGGSFSNL